ncbi:galactose-binding domain-like protein [Fomes fomentarius]|nr:galactose-binding domain-like protein [Fomes fomentarius]
MSAHNEDSVAAQLAGLDLGNLYGSIDKQNVHGLNLTVPEDAQALIKPWDERDDTSRFAESGVDDQIIIHVPFSQSVRLRSVLLKLGRGELTPRRLRIYANRPNIVDFSEAEDITPQLNISLLEGDSGVTEYPLRTASFANIHSLSLFFSESVGGESLQLYYIGFKGDNRSQRKEGTQKLEVPAEVAPGAKLIDRLQEKTGGRQTTAR